MWSRHPSTNGPRRTARRFVAELVGDQCDHHGVAGRAIQSGPRDDGDRAATRVTRAISLSARPAFGEEHRRELAHGVVERPAVERKRLGGSRIPVDRRVRSPSDGEHAGVRIDTGNCAVLAQPPPSSPGDDARSTPDVEQPRSDADGWHDRVRPPGTGRTAPARRRTRTPAPRRCSPVPVRLRSCDSCGRSLMQPVSDGRCDGSVLIPNSAGRLGPARIDECGHTASTARSPGHLRSWPSDGHRSSCGI